MDITKLEQWVNQDDRRKVEITLQKGHKRIWVYDYNIHQGVFLDSPEEEFDLLKKKEEIERREYERLKAKYGT